MLSPQSCPDTTTSDISSSQSCLTPSPQTPPLTSYQPTPVISNRSSPQCPHDSLLHQTPPLSSSQPISCHLRQPSSQFLPHFRPSPLPRPARLSVPSDTSFTHSDPISCHLRSPSSVPISLPVTSDPPLPRFHRLPVTSNTLLPSFHLVSDPTLPRIHLIPSHLRPCIPQLPPTSCPFRHHTS